MSIIWLNLQLIPLKISQWVSVYCILSQLFRIKEGLIDLLAACFDLITVESPEDSKNLTEALLTVFSYLLKAAENQVGISSVYLPINKVI